MEVTGLEQLNSVTADEAASEFLKCCGSNNWARQVTAARPFASLDELTASGDQIWWALEPGDWLEAFHSHPKIGEKKAAEQVSAQSQQWSGQEQSGVANAPRDTVDSLAALNEEYEQKFGFIFIICATGKTGEEMLSALRERLEHDAETELPIAAAEQAKITELRLKKLLTSS
jgi:OHCU decarboxylase